MAFSYSQHGLKTCLILTKMNTFSNGSVGRRLMTLRNIRIQCKENMYLLGHTEFEMQKNFMFQE